MGLFSYFKKVFNKNIENDEAFDNELVHLYSKEPAAFNIGYNILVRPGFNAVFVVNDRVTDVLPSGKFRIGLESLPITFRKLKLDRITKKASPKKFRADVYFVNTCPFKDVKFCGSRPYVNKTKEFGRVSAYIEGTCTLQVEDAGDLVAYTLLDRPYVTNKQAIKICGTYIGNACNNVLEKSKMTIKDIFKNPNEASAYIGENVNSKLKDLGVSVSQVSLKFLDVNSRLQQKISSSIDEEKDFVDEYNKISNADVPTEQLEPKFIVENNVEELTNEEAKVEDNYTVDTSDKVEMPETSDVPPVGYVKCPSCGAENSQKAHFCSNCGFNLDTIF